MSGHQQPVAVDVGLLQQVVEDAIHMPSAQVLSTIRPVTLDQEGVIFHSDASPMA